MEMRVETTPKLRVHSVYLRQKYDCGAKVMIMHVRLGKEFG
jgi:hypothetical protein